MRANPNDRYTEYVRNFQGRQERPITTMPVMPPPPDFSNDPGARVEPGMPMGNFKHYGIDEYGRGAGEGFGTAPPPGQLPGMGNFDPFYQQRMALDAQVTARNSQGQNATPEQMAEMRRLSELSENDPGVNARRDALNKEAMERGIFYTQGAGTPGMTPGQIANTPGMGMAGIGMNFPGLDGTRIPGEGPGLFGSTTGIASLAKGGYPRRTGQISGPGTEKSDSIPAMLSDGEFVLTAKAVRGADPTGKGNRRAGAKQMYKLMHQLEKNSERG
jgi:hypothetical protein